MTLAFGIAIAAALHFGNLQNSGTGFTAPAATQAQLPSSPGTPGRPLALLLLQILVIFPLARGMGKLFARLGQPAVVGEIIAGLALGPSLLGWLAPGLQNFLFPSESLAVLGLLSQIGILIFMFLVGLEVDFAELKKSAHTAVLVSHISILFPFLLGSLLSLALYRHHAPQGVSFLVFALFMSIAMSITAFPVLARILQEKKLSATPLGGMALAAASVDDVTAWTLLALIVALGGSGGAIDCLFIIALLIGFAAVMFLLVRPLLGRFYQRYLESRGVSPVGISLFLLLASAYATERIGVHALFGAFLAGAVLPRHNVIRKTLIDRFEYFGSVFLMPLFFVVTGLRTRIGLLDDGGSWLLCTTVLGVAILGKLGGTYAAARLAGTAPRESFALGALMNTRGLIELVVLNIAYEMGIFSEKLFAAMVLMALVTTFMTGPLVSLSLPSKPSPRV